VKDTVQEKTCEEVDVVKDEEISSFSIHGFLKPLNDTQYGTTGRKMPGFTAQSQPNHLHNMPNQGC
jgi:hypothetical protein